MSEAAGESYELGSRRERRLAIAVALVAFLAYNANLRCIATGDSYPARFLPFALWTHGTVYLDPVIEPTIQNHPRPYWVLRTYNGHWASLFPVVTPLVVAPLYGPAVLYMHAVGWDRADLDRVGLLMEKLAASTVTSLAVGLMYLVLRRRVSRRDALVLVAVFALGTGTWSTSSQALWLHAVAELAAVAALWCMTSEPTVPHALGAGVAVAVIGVNRPPDVFIAAAFAVYALFWLRKRVGWFVLGGLVPGLLVLGYNVVCFHDLAGAWGISIGSAFFAQHSLLPGLAGLLFSPGRGLFVFSPFLLFVLVLPHRSLRDPRTRALTICLFAGILLFLLFYARTDWRAGHSYGPRYVLDLVPVLIWLLAPVAASLRGAARVVFLVLCLFSVGVEAIGAFLYTGISNQVLYDQQDPWGTRNFWKPRNAPFLIEAHNPLMRPNLLIALQGLGQPAPPAAAAAGPASFHPIPPCQIADTRGHEPLASLGPPWTYTMTGETCAIPPNASAVAARVTTVDGTENGTVRFRPALETAGVDVPIAAHAQRSVSVRLPLSALGSTTVTAHMRGQGFAHLVLEVDGYYASADAAAAPATLRLQRWREGVAAAELLPAREVRERFRCPVATLTDLAVPFATYGRENEGHVTLTLSENGREIGRTRVSAADIDPNEWISLEPASPIRECTGRELTVAVSSDDGVSGRAVTVWTYPRYYDGALTQRNGPALGDRSLGLEINRGAH